MCYLDVCFSQTLGDSRKQMFIYAAFWYKEMCRINVLKNRVWSQVIWDILTVRWPFFFQIDLNSPVIFPNKTTSKTTRINHRLK